MYDEPEQVTPSDDLPLKGWRGLRAAFQSAVMGLGELFSALLEPFRGWH